MSAGNVAGWLMLAAALSAIVGATIWAIGWREALLVWTVSLALTAMIVFGLRLVLS